MATGERPRRTTMILAIPPWTFMASNAPTIPTSPLPIRKRSWRARAKGKESKLSYAAHVLMENRHGLAVNSCVTQATGRAEPEAALAMVEEIPGWQRVTLGADKGYA